MVVPAPRRAFSLPAARRTLIIVAALVAVLAICWGFADSLAEPTPDEEFSPQNVSDNLFSAASQLDDCPKEKAYDAHSTPTHFQSSTYIIA